MKGFIVFAIIALALCQLATCNSVAESAEKQQHTNGKPMPLMIVRQSKQSSSSSSSSNSKQNPDFWLIWLQPYEGMIPKPMMDAINQNIRPQTEQITSQVMDQVPGAEEFYSQLSQFQNTLSNIGGLQSVLSGAMGGSGGSGSGSSGSSGGLSSLMGGFGRR